jgi:hypothetical protein
MDYHPLLNFFLKHYFWIRNAKLKDLKKIKYFYVEMLGLDDKKELHFKISLSK